MPLRRRFYGLDLCLILSYTLHMPRAGEEMDAYPVSRAVNKLDTNGLNGWRRQPSNER